MNCKHMDYYDNNYRCKRKISEENGLVLVDGSIVSEFDSCRYFDFRERK